MKRTMRSEKTFQRKFIKAYLKRSIKEVLSLRLFRSETMSSSRIDGSDQRMPLCFIHSTNCRSCSANSGFCIEPRFIMPTSAFTTHWILHFGQMISRFTLFPAVPRIFKSLSVTPDPQSLQRKFASVASMIDLTIR